MAMSILSGFTPVGARKPDYSVTFVILTVDNMNFHTFKILCMYIEINEIYDFEERVL